MKMNKLISTKLNKSISKLDDVYSTILSYYEVGEDGIPRLSEKATEILSLIDELQNKIEDL